MSHPAATLSSAQHHTIFRAVLTALAEPGQRRELSGAVGTAALPGLLSAIWEPDTPIWAADLPSAPTFGKPVGPEEADLLLVDGGAADVVAKARIGTALYPEHGATVVVLGSSTPTTVTLSGPGVPGSVEVDLPASRALLEARDGRCAEPPTGVDLLFVNGGSLIGLPRTTTITYPRT